MKSRGEDLAIFGGPPAFSEALHVGRPNVFDRARFLDRVNKMLDRRWLTNDGPLVQEFEQRLADICAIDHCIAVCNATLGLELLIRACGLTGEVIVPSFTFVATVHALQTQSIVPHFCDIGRDTHSIDPRRIERSLTSRTSAILAVHLWGRIHDVEILADLAARHGLTLLFDAAHAFGCSYQGVSAGGFGRAEVFSFHATKFLNTFEGGAIATNDGDLAGRLRLMRNFGFRDFDSVVSLGTNAKMSEVSAAMGLTALESLDRVVACNRANHEQYAELLNNLPGVKLLAYDETESCNYQYVVVEIDERGVGLNRDELMRILWAENVLARRYFFPGCHRMEPYRALYPEAPDRLPVTEQVCSRVLQLPTGTAVGPDEVAVIGSILRLVVDEAPKVKRLLEKESRDSEVTSVP